MNASLWFLLSLAALPAHAATPSFLSQLSHTTTLVSTTPENGDQNPYAIFVAPVTAGKIKAGDVLVDNFNDTSNRQGLGTTIVVYRQGEETVSTFAQIPRTLAGCPGGVGLSTAMAVLKTGWVIVGSAPSTDGTTATKGAGCLIVLDANGKVAATWSNPLIDAPWGNMAVVDHGSDVTLFFSNAGFGLKAPSHPPEVRNQASVLRLNLAVEEGQIPVVKATTVVGSGFGEQADAGVFLIGPTGLALSGDGSTLYVSDALANRVVALDNALLRQDSAGTGRPVFQGGSLQRPLAMITAPNGNLIVTNGLDGKAVEIDPIAQAEVGTFWLDTDKAQDPPGSGDLFGIALNAAGTGLLYVEDDMNTLNEALF